MNDAIGESEKDIQVPTDAEMGGHAELPTAEVIKAESVDPLATARIEISQERARLASTQTTDILNPIAYQQLKQVATDMFNSKAFPKSIENPLQALMLMQAGFEMGLKPIQSVNSLYMVNGQINIWGKAIIARLTNSGYRITYEDKQDECIATVDGGQLGTYTETVTFQDAEKSGYTKTAGGSLKPGWIDGINRRLKLRYQALSMILKTYLPHLLGSTAGIVEVNEDWEPKKYEIEVGGKTLPKPGRAVDVVTEVKPKESVASKIMEDVGGTNE